ncbi:MAG: cohesin domain-containing protein [Aureispira sp.]
MRLIILFILFWSIKSHSLCAQSLALNCGHFFITSGDTLEIPITTTGFDNLISFQASIQFDPSIIELVDIDNFANSFSANNVTVNNGVIRVVWFVGQAVTLGANDTLFIVKIRAIGSVGAVSPIDFVNTPLALEAFNSNFNLLNINTSPGSVRIIDLILPINLVKFDVDRINTASVHLSWNIDKHYSGSFFEIERLLDGHNSSSTIARIESKLGVINYQYNDNNTYDKTSYYRLRMIEQDGAVTYSNWKAINGWATTKEAIKVFSHNGNIYIKTMDLEHSSPTEVMLYNHNGQLLVHQTIHLSSYELIPLQTINAAYAHLYLVRLVLPNGIIKTQKIMLK